MDIHLDIHLTFKNKLTGWWWVNHPITDPISGSSLGFDVRDDPELDNFLKARRDQRMIITN